MSSVNELEIQLEQALLSVLAAADQLGLDPENLRLIAIGGLLASNSWQWIDPYQTPGTIAVLNRAVGAVSSRSQCE
ncbi:hypothetical protein [Pseudomonas sp. SWRI77]|uniref:hypothetical protein n=1 Tax=Pseudomonas sp. SWRI77 TaxID=2745485 RepID=UPI00164555EF|nr:hypothetical protein [Pseudomonas sp. SWRI77]MBC3480318.1 hypothetical protein [Pseudomonas sp. SWRI77]